MRKFLPALLTLLALNCLGQEWIQYKFDDNLILSIPDKLTIIDTLGQHVVTSDLDPHATIIIQTIPIKESGATFQDKEELREGYRRYVIVAAGREEAVLTQTFGAINGLQACRFSFRATLEGEKSIRHCLLVSLNEKWYTIYFWETEGLTDKFKRERDRLFASVKFSPLLTLKDQLSGPPGRSDSYKLGYKLGKYLFYIVLVGVPLGIAVAIARRNTKNRRRKEEQDSPPISHL